MTRVNKKPGPSGTPPASDPPPAKGTTAPATAASTAAAPGWSAKGKRGKSPGGNPPPSAGSTGGASAPAGVLTSVTAAQYTALANGIAGKLGGIGSTIHVEAPPTGAIPTADALATDVKSTIETPNAELSKALGNGLTEIPFKYIPDGCYARAQVMDQVLGDQGIDNAKIFVIGNLHAANTDFPQGVNWWYHVAPLVVVNDNGQPALRVVDPAVDPNPLTPEDWISRIDPSRQSVKIEITNRAQYYPENGGAPTNQSFAANLAPAQGTMKQYTGTLAGVQNGAPHTHTGTPLSVTANTATFKNSAMVYKVTNPAHHAALTAAMKSGKAVSLTAVPHTGEVTGVK